MVRFLAKTFALSLLITGIVFAYSQVEDIPEDIEYGVYTHVYVSILYDGFEDEMTYMTNITDRQFEMDTTNRHWDGARVEETLKVAMTEDDLFYVYTVSVDRDSEVDGYVSLAEGSIDKWTELTKETRDFTREPYQVTIGENWINIQHTIVFH